MTMIPSLLLLLTMQVPAAPEAANAREPVVAPTGEPVLVDSTGGKQWGVALERYHEQAKMVAEKSGAFIPIQRMPEGLGPDARYGWNLQSRGKNVGWALDDKRERLYADINANGDLTDDPPLPVQVEDGRKVARLRTTVQDAKGESYPMEWKLVLNEGPKEGEVSLSIHNKTFRKGTARLGDRDLLFAVEGSSGIYGLPLQTVRFDLNGDGKLEGKEESFRMTEKYLTLGERSWEFSVDRYGRNLTLQPLAEKLAARPPVEIGRPAPDFSGRDLLGGKTVRLADYQGKLVLLDFWSVHCGPCVAEAPALVAAYRRFRERGFEIVGVNYDDEAPAVKAFVEKHGTAWPQLKGQELWDLYRVVGFPHYFLVGRDGTLLATSEQLRADKEALARHVEKHLAE